MISNLGPLRIRLSLDGAAERQYLCYAHAENLSAQFRSDLGDICLQYERSLSVERRRIYYEAVTQNKPSDAVQQKRSLRSGRHSGKGMDVLCVWGLVRSKQSGFCTSTNDPLKRGHLVKQILLLIIMLWNYEWASKLDNITLSNRICILSSCDFKHRDQILLTDTY